MKAVLLTFFSVLAFSSSFSQQKGGSGMLTGNVLDENKRALDAATVVMVNMQDSRARKSATTDKTGSFSFEDIEFGYYRLTITYVGLQPLSIDSIYFRMERYDFNLGDITLKMRTSDNLEAVVVYAEKPLIQSKDGNITFNAGESATAASSNASELLTQVPLVGKDPDGKITVRGKEPKILIDDKPVELNLQQLQDLLESMPGSSIEKIEVMTNPPPQYANEQGGVINITTKKGRVGVNGRISVSAGTRGDVSANGSITYRKQGLAINLNVGTGYNSFRSNGYSHRNNIYTDSSNFLNTTSASNNKALRPNVRLSVDYDINKRNILNVVFTYFQNDFDNLGITRYTNVNRFGEVWKNSLREVGSEGINYNPGINVSYTWKGKPGETLRVIGGYNFSNNSNDRLFFQQFFTGEMSPTGQDSMQQQLNDTRINSHSMRVNYDKMLGNKKTFLSLGTAYNRNNNHVTVEASYKKKPEGVMVKMDLLSNDFWFHQTVNNYRASVKQIMGENFSFTGGTAVERTSISFELLKENREVANDYWTWLPFFNINKSWKEKLNLTLAYRRSIRRPGIGELNPTIDFSDPYNVRFGNPTLEASTAHNFDFIAGRTKSKYYINIGAGYNLVQEVFSQVRTLLPDGKTQVTWENISDRREYELSTWNGVTLHKKWKINASASYTYNKYSEFDKNVRKFRDGGSFSSNINLNVTPTDRWNVTGNFNVNRFANPQGYARWNTSTSFGVQRKFLNKKLVVTLNAIDPFSNQQRKAFTYGTNFNLESYSSTQTRNFRVSAAYSFTKIQKKKPIADKR